jgi:rubrerythrin
MHTSNLLEAIRVVKENERIAKQSYEDAAGRMQDSMGKTLFEQLSAFEQYHYERLTALEKSLEETGEYIDYEGMDFPMPPVFEIKAAQDCDQKSLMQIITEARELETEAEQAYADLAMQITDQRGHDMFMQLSEEEHIHYRVLSDAYWTLNNLGMWKWAQPRLGYK